MKERRVAQLLQLVKGIPSRAPGMTAPANAKAKTPGKIEWSPARPTRVVSAHRPRQYSKMSSRLPALLRSKCPNLQSNTPFSPLFKARAAS